MRLGLIASSIPFGFESLPISHMELDLTKLTFEKIRSSIDILTQRKLTLSLHIPWDGRINISAKETDKDIRYIKSALKLLEEINGEYITLHLGYFYDCAKRKIHIQNSIKSIYDILDAGFESKIAIENTKPKSSISEKYFVGGATKDFETIFNEIPDSRLAMCYDIGHAAFSWDICKTIKQFRKRIYCAHVHDNDGQKDHLGIGRGSIKWSEALKCLNPDGLEGPVIVEVFGKQAEPSIRQLMEYNLQ